MIKLKDIIRESGLITEGTRWLVGIEAPNGQIVSTYGHWDGYPEWAGKYLKRFYNNPMKVKQLLKLGQQGISSIDKISGFSNNPQLYDKYDLSRYNFTISFDILL